MHSTKLPDKNENLPSEQEKKREKPASQSQDKRKGVNEIEQGKKLIHRFTPKPPLLKPKFARKNAQRIISSNALKRRIKKCGKPAKTRKQG